MKIVFAPHRPPMWLRVQAWLMVLLCALLAWDGMWMLAAMMLSSLSMLPAVWRGQLLGTNSATIKGDTSVLWGTGGLTQTSYSGILTAVRDQRTGEMVEVSDVNGFTTSVVFFNHRHECEIHVVVQTAFPTWDRGSVITINGIATCIVTNFEKMWENKKVAEYSVKATAWDGIPSP
jgi:hypothetical protein